jgi:hypothetical protein
MEDGKHVTITRLMHSSGQWIEDGGVPLILSKDDMQGLGSALTYSRRYGLMSMVGVAPEDDDGNAASQKPNGATTAAPSKPPEGFNTWVLDLEAAADNGRDALNAMWAKSRPELREFLQKTVTGAVEKLRARAAKAKVGA